LLANFEPQFEQAGYRTVVVPASSPAPAHMAMTFEQKLDVWRRLNEQPEKVNVDSGQGRPCLICAKWFLEPSG
jgi:hypothetical protein